VNHHVRKSASKQKQNIRKFRLSSKEKVKVTYNIVFGYIHLFSKTLSFYKIQNSKIAKKELTTETKEMHSS